MIKIQIYYKNKNKNIVKKLKNGIDNKNYY